MPEWNTQIQVAYRAAGLRVKCDELLAPLGKRRGSVFTTSGQHVDVADLEVAPLPTLGGLWDEALTFQPVLPKGLMGKLSAVGLRRCPTTGAFAKLEGRVVLRLC